jgi:hypothetical protein
MRLLIALALLVLGSCAWAQSSFSLRNIDSVSVFYYWTVPGDGPRPQAEVLPLLPVAPGGRHGVAPGERVRVVLPTGRLLVGVFVPWADNLSFRSPITGGFLLPSEVPDKGTLQVSQKLFVAANQGRLLEAPLQQWGLIAPQFVLAGQGDVWAKVRPAAEWGPAFLPGNKPWPMDRPKPKSLQVADREGALWLRLQSSLPWSAFGPQVSASLVLRRPGATLEWPLTGDDGTVWLWKDGAASAVGWRVLRGGELEAWVPWDRLSDDEKNQWLDSKLIWSLVVADKIGTRTLDLGTTAAGEWP